MVLVLRWLNRKAVVFIEVIVIKAVVVVAVFLSGGTVT